MRLLVYAMQSGGATAFSLFLAQRPDCLALVDTPNNFAAPRVRTSVDMMVKVVATTAYPLEVHTERFRPDRTILLLRDPHDTYQSLRTKNYRNYSGLMDEKFILFDQVVAGRDHFDAVIRYEDFVCRSPAVLETVCQLGWPVTEDYFVYRRRHEELAAGLWMHAPEMMETMDFAFGNVQGKDVSERFLNKPRDPETERKLQDLCPRWLRLYRQDDGIGGKDIA